MKTEYVRNFAGRILGSIQTEKNGDATGKNFIGQILGIYSAEQNATLEFPSRRVIAKGNILASLIMNDAIKRGNY